ncbi:MAG: hypothetical protein JJT96_06795 [Opitutales bacterium]|nr:hypothetical protein [Opitutales bacterium]
MYSPPLRTFLDSRLRLELRCCGDPATALTAELAKAEGRGSAGDPVRFHLRVCNGGEAPWSGLIEVGLHRETSSPRFFLPGVLYGTNRGDHPLARSFHRHFPRLRPGPVEPPHAPRWSARSDQLTHPLAALHTAEGFLALSTAPQPPPGHPAIGFWCALEAGRAAIGCTFGHRDDPGLYRSPFAFEPPSEDPASALHLAPGEVFTGDVFVYCFGAECIGLGRLLEDTYRRFHAPPRAGEPPKEAVEAMAAAIVEDAYEPERKTFALIWMNPVEAPPGEPPRYSLAPPEQTTYRRFHEGGIAWTNGLVIAVPLLQAAARLGRPEWRIPARAVINDIVAHSLNPRTGLPYAAKIDGIWSNRGWWARWIESEGQPVGHPAYLVGQALCYLAKASEWEERAGETAPAAWDAFSARVLETILPSPTHAGAFPRFWDEETGSGYDDEGFAGCWVAAALAAHGARTGRKDWLMAAERAERHYFTSGVARMECVKTPLDVADAADAEGILGYIRLNRLLDEHAPEPERLQRLRHGLDYALSFVFCHNVRVPGPPLDAHPWSSAGGSITSVGNAVVHAMTNRILDDIEYARRRTNDPYLGERLRDIYRWGLQTFNRHDHDFFFGKRGWATEYFCQAGRYVLDIRLADGQRSNVWFAYHPWATASLIEGICGDLWERRADLAADHRGSD